MRFVIEPGAPPTTAGEKAVYHALPREKRSTWCPIREAWIATVVCARLQDEKRRFCERVNGGHGCKHLDASWAEDLQRARREELEREPTP